MLDYLLLAQTQSPGSQGRTPGLLDMFFPMILMFIIMYVILIKPQNKKQKLHKEMVNKLKVGDNVVTSGGIYGSISAVKEDSIMLKVADSIKIKINRANISETISEAKKEKK